MSKKILTVGMMAGTVFYPLVSKVLKPKGIMFAGGIGIGVYYLALISCMPLYENKWFMYVFVAVMSVLFGFCIAIANTFMQVEFMKRIDGAYLARAASIMTSLGAIATPIVGFVISAIAIVVRTEWIFVAAGILDIVICLFMLCSKVLDDNEESGLETI